MTPQAPYTVSGSPYTHPLGYTPYAVALPGLKAASPAARHQRTLHRY
eukprot:CAMPEP_0172030682 /NCGR_PEP_ID=MMETSP1041-20130122/18864_1 /TAXON_ID=464988 /ORGANISM="Hemiselmis andersenii, Strain CCMP439" /LENGTH=46 /DNA_ID= /DNA_START= /DNA_END= /DNA_ORIENTATION=